MPSAPDWNFLYSPNWPQTCGFLFQPPKCLGYRYFCYVCLCHWVFLLFSVSWDSSPGMCSHPTEGSISFTQALSAWLSPSLTAGLNLTSSQGHTSQMMLASMRRPSEKEGFRWMLPLWSSSASWHTCVPSMSSTARSCTLYVPCGILLSAKAGFALMIGGSSARSPWPSAVSVRTRVSLALEHQPACSSQQSLALYIDIHPHHTDKAEDCENSSKRTMPEGLNPRGHACPLSEDVLLDAMPNRPLHCAHGSIPLLPA